MILIKDLWIQNIDYKIAGGGGGKGVGEVNESKEFEWQ